MRLRSCTAVVLLFVCSLLVLTPVLAAEDAEPRPEARPEKAAAQPVQPSRAALAALEAELQEQRALIEEMMQQMREQAAQLAQLHQQLSAAKPAFTPSATRPEIATATNAGAGLAIPASAGAPKLTVTAEPSRPATGAATANQSAAAQQEVKVKGLGNIAFSGDLRLRFEPFRGGTGPDRNRARYRVRFSAKSKFSDEWQGGFRITSGSDNEPISTNQTDTGFFTRKPINIDRAYLTYTPNWAKPLSITGGKFGVTWQKTEMTFDSDLNPEGLSETLSFDLENAGPLGNVTVVGYQLPFRESGSGPDSYLMGGQLQSKWNVGGGHKFSASAGYSNWFRTDTIRVAQTGGSLSGSTNRNAASATAFASRFGIFDLIAQLDLSTGNDRWPVKLLFDYVVNTRACAQASIAGVACNSSDRQGYWAEVGFGRTKNPKDVSFGYTLIHIEREAVLGAFNYSDLRAPTNVINHRFQFGYQVNQNLTFGYALIVGRQLETATSPQEPWLKRMQFDAAYKF